VLHGNRQVMFHSNTVRERSGHLRMYESLSEVEEKEKQPTLQLSHCMRLVAADMVARLTIAMIERAGVLEPSQRHTTC